MKKLYFLCTGNSCRSQMAEGYARNILNPKVFDIRSAGIETHGLNPIAVKVMEEDGVDISTQASDLIDPDYFQDADLIITLCGDALDKCPAIPSGAAHEHWDLKDPARVEGTEDDIFQAFRETRDWIKAQIQTLN